MLGLVKAGSFVSIDLLLQRQINLSWTHPWIDRLMPLISDAGLWTLPIALFSLSLFIFGRFKERVSILLILISILAGDMGIVRAVRAVAHRPRPCEALEGSRYVTRSGVEIRHVDEGDCGSSGRSMPSAHVANNAAAAFFLTLFYGGWGAISWIVVLLMAYSRVYTGSHYPSDVLASIALAVLYCTLIYWIVRGFWFWAGPRWFKRMYESHPTLLK